MTAMAQIKDGRVVHHKAAHHMKQAVSLRGLRADVKAVKGFNAKFAVFLTRIVGSMACAYLFVLLALASLPAILNSTGWFAKGTFPHWLVLPSLIALVAWVAQTLIQLVLLPVIMVGQNVQAVAGDLRAQKTYEDTVEILDRLDPSTPGGVRDILLRIEKLEKAILAKPAPTRPAPVKKAQPVKKATRT